MTDRIALALAVLLLVAFAIDHFVFGSAALLFIGQKFIALIDFLEFWR